MFNNNNGSMSPADFAAMMGGNGGFGNFGNDIWGFFLIALLFGMWGGNGWGFGNGGNSNGAQAGFYATQADLQRGFDQAALANKIDNLGLSLEHGIKDPGYMISNSFSQAELSRANNQAALLAQMNNLAMMEMQDTNGTNLAILNSANQDRADTAQIRYDMATSDCAIKNAIEMAKQAIIQNDNANYRQLHDEQVAMQMEALRSQISSLQTENGNLRLAASQSAQNQYLISELRPAPVPAYPADNLYGYMNCNRCGCMS